MKKINWAIIGTGYIADTFASALKFDESAELYGVSAITESNAKAFANKHNVKNAFATNEDLVRDKNVDVVYIATPMSCHFEHILLCLENGKNVLCEKTVCLNAKELKILIEKARDKKLFFMEAMWMKFRPVFLQAKQWVELGEIGNVNMVKATFAIDAIHLESSRLFNKELGGGCLLDLGVYALHFAMDFLGDKPKKIYSCAKFGRTGVEYDASILLNYGDKYADLSFGFDYRNTNDAIIFGENGRIELVGGFVATHTIRLYDRVGNLLKELHINDEVNGYEYEIREVEKCLLSEQKESKILNSSFDWNGAREPYILATENDSLNGVCMLFGKLLTGRAQIFADVRTYWSGDAVKRVTGYDIEGKAKESDGFIHLINSGAACVDACGEVKDENSNAVMKKWWEMTDEDIDACMSATTWPYADLGYFRGGGYSSRFVTKAEMPCTMMRLNMVKGLGPVMQIAEGWTVELPDEVTDKLWKRTDYTWPCTWFAPRVTGKGAFKTAYEVMNNWGANHGAISYGHIGADLITMCSMLRIPVCMHNVEEDKIYRPASWNAFGMDKEGQDYRACQTYGPLYKK